LNKIAKAKEYLDAQKYDLARQMYAQVSDENKVIRENKEWLIALSHYLEEGRNHAGFQSTLDRILREPDHNCYNLAVQVDDRVNSFWGRLKG